MTDKMLTKWLENEKLRQAKERQDYMDMHDMKDFWKAESGENKITVLPSIPRSVKSNFGDKMAFRIEVQGKKYDWNINPKSPMYRTFVDLLAKAPVEVTVIRTGSGKTTRYDLK